MVSRREKGMIFEVGIFMGRFSGDDVNQVHWDGSSSGFGAILPVAQTVWVVGDQSWLRESFDLRIDPMDPDDERKIIHSSTLQKEGR